MIECQERERERCVVEGVCVCRGGCVCICAEEMKQVSVYVEGVEGE